VEPSSKLAVEESEISLRKAFDKKTILLLSFAAVALLIYLYLGGVSVFRLIDIMLSADFFLLVLGAFFAFLAIFIDSLAWKILLGISSIHPSTWSAYRIQLASFSYGLLIPSAGAVEGIMRIALGTQEFVNEKEDRKASSGEILSSVVVHRLCGLIAFIPISVFVALSLLNFATIIGGFEVSFEQAMTFAIVVSLISIIAIVVVILIAKWPNMAKKIILFILKGITFIPLIGKYAETAMESSKTVVDDFSAQFAYLAQSKMKSGGALILAFLSQITHWVSIYLILHSIAIPISLDQVAAINFLGGTIDAIPVGIPGMAGLKEITLSAFLISLLVSLEMIPLTAERLGTLTELAASGAIMVQLLKFYFLILIGILVYVVGKTRVSSRDLTEKMSKID
jgi:uncharacterized membrane protein YbhN (UPF0104 family)